MMMLLTTMSILLILQKEKGILHTINVSLFYFLCFPLLFLVCSPAIDNMKHNTGIMVQQTHMTGILKNVLFLIPSLDFGLVSNLKSWQ